MRPKKKLLLAGKDEKRLSELRYLLRINAYAVTAAASADEAIACATLTDFELLIVCWPFKGAAQLCERVRQMLPTCRALLLAERTVDPPELMGIDAVWARGFSSCGILDAVKVMTARKRGPRKGVQHKLPPQPATGVQEMLEGDGLLRRTA